MGERLIERFTHLNKTSKTKIAFSGHQKKKTNKNHCRIKTNDKKQKLLMKIQRHNNGFNAYNNRIINSTATAPQITKLFLYFCLHFFLPETITHTDIHIKYNKKTINQ